MKYYVKVLFEYSIFHGRAIRKEYWYFVLFHFLFLLTAIVLDILLGTNFKYDTNGVITTSYYGWIYTMYSCALLVPALSVLVRRLHDVGKSGWMMLIAIIPLIGPIWLLILLCTKSEDYDNDWGPNPNPPTIIEEEVEIEEKEISDESIITE